MKTTITLLILGIALVAGLFFAKRAQMAKALEAEMPFTPQPGMDWSKVTDEAHVDGFVLRVKSASIGTYAIRKTGERIVSKDEFLKVLIQVESTDQNRKATYRSPTEIRENIYRFARLHDEFKNSYSPETNAASERVEGRIYIASLYPNTPIDDLLIFEKPIATAKTLFLEIPGECIGSKIALRVKFETGVITRE